MLSEAIDQIDQSFDAPKVGPGLTVAPVFHLDHATYRSATYEHMTRSRLNMRRKQAGNLEELAALIASQGLLQNLVGYEQVRDGVATGVIEIVAGGRRLAALGLLIGDGRFPADFQIPYLLVPIEEAIAISLAENCGREPMHHADVLDAMLELSQRGVSPDDIALSFGVEAIVVRRRLKLAKLAPRFLKMYREDQIKLDQLMALAANDDHAVQIQAWDSLDGWSRHAGNLRRLLTAQRIEVKADRVARFVGIDAFKKAGGAVEQDLFSDAGEGYISDAALLESLAAAKLEKQANAVAKEGVAWIEVRPRIDQSTLAEFAKVRIVERPFTDEEQATLSAIDKELEQVAGDLAQQSDPEGEDVDEATVVALYARQTSLSDQRRKLCQTRFVQHAGDKALAGALVYIDGNGKPVVQRDLIRPMDKDRMEKLGKPSKADGGQVKPLHSERLVKILTSHRTVALQATLIERPDVAMVVLAHALVGQVFYSSTRPGHIAHVNLTQPPLASEVEAGIAASAMRTKRERLHDLLPKNAGDLFAWLMAQTETTVHELLAFCCACSLDAIQARETPLPAFTEVAKAVSLDMVKWWQVTAANYLDHVPKARILDVVTQTVSPAAAQSLAHMKREALVAAAQRTLADHAWLPAVLSMT